jgi:hypothetical protein
VQRMAQRCHHMLLALVDPVQKHDCISLSFPSRRESTDTIETLQLY